MFSPAHRALRVTKSTNRPIMCGLLLGITLSMASNGGRTRLGLVTIAISYAGGLAVLLMAITDIGNPYSQGDSMDMAANVDHDNFISTVMVYAAFATAVLNTLAIILGVMAVMGREPRPAQFWLRPMAPIHFGLIGYLGSVLLFVLGVGVLLPYA